MASNLSTGRTDATKRVSDAGTRAEKPLFKRLLGAMAAQPDSNDVGPAGKSLIAHPPVPGRVMAPADGFLRAEAVAGAPVAPPKEIDARVKSLTSRVLAAAETGDPNGDPAGVYVFADGNGGRRQVTLGMGFTEDGGNLRPVIEDYLKAGGTFGMTGVDAINKARATMTKLVKDIGQGKLASNSEFKNLLISAGKKDTARFAKVQNDHFINDYLTPALKWYQDNGFKNPLSFMVIADSFLHSGRVPDFLRSRFPEKVPAAGGDEKKWVEQYLNARQSWLSTHSNPILRNTVYRTKAYLSEVKRGNWNLTTVPIKMNGISVSP